MTCNVRGHRAYLAMTGRVPTKEEADMASIVFESERRARARGVEREEKGQIFVNRAARHARRCFWRGARVNLFFGLSSGQGEKIGFPPSQATTQPLQQPPQGMKPTTLRPSSRAFTSRMGLATLSIVVLASAAVVTHSQQDHADDGGSGEGSSAAYPISDASSMGTAAAAAAAAAIPMPVVDIETVPGQLMKLSELSDAEPGTGVTRLIFTEKDVAGRRGARIRRVFFRANELWRGSPDAKYTKQPKP
jgi:hypothetical protein